MELKRLLKGVQILCAYAPDDECSTGRDELFFGGPPPEEMTDEDAAKLAELNFRWDAHSDSWAVFT